VDAALDLLATRPLAGKGLNLMLLDAGGTVRAAETSALSAATGVALTY